MWGRWYLPLFLFRDGSLTLISIASLIALVRFWSSLPTMVNLLMLIFDLRCYNGQILGKGGFWCSLNLSAKVLPDSPMYSSPHPCSLHWYLYITPLLLLMGSLSLGAIRRLLMVCPPLKCTCTPYLLHVFLTLSLRPWWYGTTIYKFWLLLFLGPFWLAVLLCFLLGFWLFSFALFMAHVWYLHFSSALAITSANLVLTNMLKKLQVSP